MNSIGRVMVPFAAFVVVVVVSSVNVVVGFRFLVAVSRCSLNPFPFNSISPSSPLSQSPLDLAPLQVVVARRSRNGTISD